MGNPQLLKCLLYELLSELGSPGSTWYLVVPALVGSCQVSGVPEPATGVGVEKEEDHQVKKTE